MNNLPSGFLFSDHENFGDFVLLFCRGQLINVQKFKEHVLSYCSGHYIYYFLHPCCSHCHVSFKVPYGDWLIFGRQQFKKFIVWHTLFLISSLRGFIMNQQYDQLSVGLLPQLAEHCTSIAEVMGSNPVQTWIFFRSYFLYHLSSVH